MPTNKSPTVPSPGTLAPKDFEIRKYGPAKNFGLVHWAHEISNRLVLDGLLEEALSGKVVHKRKPERLPEILEEHFQFPLTADNPASLEEFKHSMSLWPDEKSKIHDLKTYQLVMLRQHLVSAYESLLDDASEESFNFDLADAICKFDDIHSSVDEVLLRVAGKRHGTATLVVSLDGSDKDIEDEFSSWLRKRRAISGKTILHSEKKLRQWSNNQVLPYADLKLWSKWTGKKLSDPIILELLFPAKYFPNRRSGPGNSDSRISGRFASQFRREGRIQEQEHDKENETKPHKRVQSQSGTGSPEGR